MRINDMLNPTSVPPRAHEEKQKEAHVQPSNAQLNVRLDTFRDHDGRATKRKKSADSNRAIIKQMSGQFALKSSNAGVDTDARTVTTDPAEPTPKRAADKNRIESSTTWLAKKIAVAKAAPGDPAFSVLNFKPERPLTRAEELINTYLQHKPSPRAAAYVTQLRHFNAWALNNGQSREPLDDVLNLELTPKDQPAINAWRNTTPNPYAREGYAAFNDFRAAYGKTVDPRKKPPLRYDKMVNLDDA
ncbi:hypothetical protein IHE30_06150 [Mycetohabitans sp. B46]